MKPPKRSKNQGPRRSVRLIVWHCLIEFTVRFFEEARSPNWCAPFPCARFPQLIKTLDLDVGKSTEGALHGGS